MKRIPILFFMVLLLIGSKVKAQQWQWSAIIKNSKENPGRAKAYLWIPENCEKVRGVVLAQNNMEEIAILENPLFRKQMADLGFAEIWVSPFFDRLFRFNEGSGDTFNGMMADLAQTSGYKELKFVPIVPMGHSAAASWPYYFAAWKPERTLAAISVSGQWPYFRDPAFAPDIWGKRNIDHVPCLETMGEYEAANTWCIVGLKERKEHPSMPLSMLACPAEGHFAATDKKVKYIAFYIKKAVQYRLTDQMLKDSTIILKPIDPLKTGWLVDRWRKDEPPAAKASPVGLYKGDPDQAFWFFDKEMAEATEKYESEYKGMSPQLLGYIQNGKTAKQSNTHLQVDLKFEPEADGITFKLKGTFLDTVPGESPRPADWTGLRVGSPLGHAKNNIPVSINRISGPFKKIDNETFQVQFSQGIISNRNQYELCFAANHPGDGQYKPAIQQAHLFIPAANTEGKDQVIHFPFINNQIANKRGIKLNASSDAGLPVHYYVEEGPAVVTGDRLMFTPIPPGSRYPVKVTVVAWQYGTSAEPKVKSASAVTRIFYVLK